MHSDWTCAYVAEWPGPGVLTALEGLVRPFVSRCGIKSVFNPYPDSIV